MAVLAFLVVGVLRQLGLIALRLGGEPGALITSEGLDRGTPAPDLRLKDIRSGSWVSLAQLPPQARVIVFTSPTCSSCHALVPHLNEVASVRAREYAFTVICTGDAVACTELSSSVGGTIQLLADPDGRAQAAFGVSLTPFVYLLDYQRRVVVRGVANTWPQLDLLLDQEGTPESPSTRYSVVADP